MCVEQTESQMMKFLQNGHIAHRAQSNVRLNMVESASGKQVILADIDGSVSVYEPTQADKTPPIGSSKGSLLGRAQPKLCSFLSGKMRTRGGIGRRASLKT